MSDPLRISGVQLASGLDPAQNRAALDVVADLAPTADLVVFPEACARDFGRPGSDLREAAEPLDGPFVSRLHELSAEHDVAILAGMFEATDTETPYNTLVLVDGGTTWTYRKIHLYDSFGYRESDVLRAGDLVPTVAQVRGFSIGLMTCYDLRFPELARQLSAAGAETIVVPAAWVAGDRKVDHWRTLLRARAIENLCYVVGVAQSGPRYSGHSTVISPRGDVLTEAGLDDAVISQVLEPAEVAQAREDNPSLDNRRM